MHIHVCMLEVHCFFAYILLPQNWSSISTWHQSQFESLPMKTQGIWKAVRAHFMIWLSMLLSQTTKSPFINAIFDKEPLQNWKVEDQIVLLGEAARKSPQRPTYSPMDEDRTYWHAWLEPFRQYLCPNQPQSWEVAALLKSCLILNLKQALFHCLLSVLW